MDLFRVVVDFSASRQSDDDDDPDHQEPVQCKQPAKPQNPKPPEDSDSETKMPARCPVAGWSFDLWN